MKGLGIQIAFQQQYATEGSGYFSQARNNGLR